MTKPLAKGRRPNRTWKVPRLERAGSPAAYLAVVRRVSALVAVIAVVAVVVMLNQAISASDVEAFLGERGWLGPLVFVVTMWILQPLLLPGPCLLYTSDAADDP